MQGYGKYVLQIASLKYMHSFLLDFLENKFLITALYLHENNAFGTYDIDKSSFEHHIYDIKP
jgi:hypothetical protein